MPVSDFLKVVSTWAAWSGDIITKMYGRKSQPRSRLQEPLSRLISGISRQGRQPDSFVSSTSVPLQLGSGFLVQGDVSPQHITVYQ